MDFSIFKSVLWGLFFAVSLMQLAACQKSDGVESHATPVVAKAKSEKGSKSGAELDANWILFNMKILNDSHQFFSESWKVLIKQPTAKPSSVFSETMQLMQKLASEQGVLKASEEVGRNCTNTKNALVITYREMGVAKAKSAKKSPEILELQVQDCNGKLISKTAEFRLVNKGQIQMKFHTGNLKEGSGLRLATLNLETTCTAVVKDTARVTNLKCEHLGQSVNDNRHEEFEFFSYDQTNPTKILEFKSKAYGADLKLKTKDNCDTTVSVPVEGKIKVVESCPDVTPKLDETLEIPTPLKTPMDLPNTRSGDLNISASKTDSCDDRTQQGDQRDIDEACKKIEDQKIQAQKATEAAAAQASAAKKTK